MIEPSDMAAVLRQDIRVLARPHPRAIIFRIQGDKSVWRSGYTKGKDSQADELRMRERRICLGLIDRILSSI